MKVVMSSDNPALLHVIEIAKAMGIECAVANGDDAATVEGSVATEPTEQPPAA